MAEHLNILTVDDDEADVILLRRKLGSIEDWTIELEHVTGSVEAVAAVERGNFDVLFVDFELGAETGMHVLAAVKDTTFDGPVIFVSGRDSDEAAVEALRNGASDYLVKASLSPDVLKRSITVTCDRARARQSAQEQQTDLERSNHDLKMRNAEIQAFYQTLSHELKTPLTAAHSFVEILLDEIPGTLNHTQADYLKIVRESCDQMLVCTNDLLDSTRLETGKLLIDAEPSSVADLVNRVATSNQPLAMRSAIELTVTAEEGLPDGLLDRARVQQIVTNLVNNAIKFTPPEGRVEITVGLDQEDEDRIRVAITDTGIGIETEKLGRIFDRLYQVGSLETEAKGGLGLGLHICRELVNLHGGDIWVSSRKGQGSTFAFNIPRADAQRVGQGS